MLLTVDCITPDIVQSLLMVMFQLLQYSRIRAAIASFSFIILILFGF